jgi:outer membrane protein TolC
MLSVFFKPTNSLGQVKNTNDTFSEQSKTINAVPDSLTLEQCIKIALENNPGIGYKKWEIKAVNAQRNEAVSQRWPSFNGIGSYYHYSDTQRLAPPRRLDYPLIFADDVLAWNLRVSIPILNGRRITNEIEAAELFQQSAEHHLVYTRQELIFNVSSVFLNILKQREIIKFLDFSRTTLDEHIKRVKGLIAAKKAAKVDLLRLEVRLADIMQKMEQEKNLLAIQNRFLANLMGVNDINFTISPQIELQFVEKKINLEESLNKAYTNRADYHAALTDVKAQAKKVKVTQAAYWPSVSIYGSYGAKKAVGSYIKPPGVNGLEDIGQLGCFFDIPFFDGGKTKAYVSQEQAKLALHKEKLRELELKIRLDVELAVFNLLSTKKRILFTEKAIEQANESLRIEMEKYNLGKGSITNVLDAQSALLDVQTSHYIALADYNISIAQLQLAQGGE